MVKKTRHTSLLANPWFSRLGISVLITVSVVLRFWHIGQNFIFDIDTEYQSLFGATLLKHFHILWIGVSAGNIGYYLGPGLVYLTAILLWFTKGDPISLAYFASSVGVVTSVSTYYIANRLYGRKTALIAFCLYGFSAFIISYDRRYWPIGIPLIALWIFYSLEQAKTNTRWLIFASLLIGASYHIHLSLLFFWLFCWV